MICYKLPAKLAPFAKRVIAEATASILDMNLGDGPAPLDHTLALQKIGEGIAMDADVFLYLPDWAGEVLTTCLYWYEGRVECENDENDLLTMLNALDG